MENKNVNFSTHGVIDLLAKYKKISPVELVADFLDVDRNTIKNVKLKKINVSNEFFNFGKNTFLEKEVMPAYQMTFCASDQGVLKQYYIIVNDFGLSASIEDLTQSIKDGYLFRGKLNTFLSKEWRGMLYNFDKDFIVKELIKITKQGKTDTFSNIYTNLKNEAEMQR